MQNFGQIMPRERGRILSSVTRMSAAISGTTLTQPGIASLIPATKLLLRRRFAGTRRAAAHHQAQRQPADRQNWD
jgi:hypothetical protein